MSWAVLQQQALKANVVSTGLNRARKCCAANMLLHSVTLSYTYICTTEYPLLVEKKRGRFV